MQPLTLYVEVPICAFRPHSSREYQDTYPVPPPAAVYGMLLSLVGVIREEKDRHRGVQMILGLESTPERSRVFRKFRRGDDPASLRPDYQDLLIDLKLWLWLRPGNDPGQPSLCQQVSAALRRPESIQRSGGLSLGESSYLVEEVSFRSPGDRQLTFLKPAERGFYNLPVWVDHQDFTRTRTRRIELVHSAVNQSLLDQCWIEIE